MFTHLHVHTKYSILDGTSHISDLVSFAKEQGFSHLAITDHGNMFGCVEFYKACKKNDITPIIGCEVYVCENRFLKEKSNRSHLVLLAENEIGYQNLVKIVSRGYSEGFYYKPRVDYELLKEYHEGLICLSACIAGDIPKAILNHQQQKAEKIALMLRDIFGKDNFFLEIQNHGLDQEKRGYNGVIEIARKYNIPLVCTNDVHCTRKEDWIVQEIAVCIRDNKTLDMDHRSGLNDDFYYLKSEDEMRMLFPDIQEAFDNTQLIANRCKVDLDFEHSKLPKYHIPDGKDAKTYLGELCLEGLKRRYDNYEEHLPRMEYELGVINDMGFTEYFLIVWDFINWAKKNDISVGPGRGSAAGSIVSFSLGISDIDPIKYDLFFERFLNPERVSMPDIDTDFEYSRREEVINYVKDLYGSSNVVQISTMQTMAAKQAVKRVGKTLGYPFSVTNKITKAFPKELGLTLKDIVAYDEMSEIYNSEKNLMDLAMKVEGLPLSTGTHAAGVIICPSDASDYIPLNLSAGGDTLASQYNMVEVEELGLLKMDFLGLRTLSVIKDCVRFVKQRHGIHLDMSKVSFEDASVFQYISKGKTGGVFQLESPGMQKFMRKLKPRNIEDVIAGISLYRPGPMDSIPNYIRNKNNPNGIKYPCKELVPILQNTYGIIVYQEQVMKIFQDLAGYSLGQADNIRRAMSKKKQSVIDAERESFINGDKSRNITGCVANGINAVTAGEIFDSMNDFAKYAFNKSHAAAYAYVLYQTAFLKKYYPKEYYAALFSSVADNTDKLKGYVECAKKDKIKILPPNINISTDKFIPTDKGIVFALNAVKGISDETARGIVSARESGFTSIYDAISRLKSIIEKDGLNNLINTGAFDCFEGNRHQKILVAEKILSNERASDRKNVPGQLSLFDSSEIEVSLPFAEEFFISVLLENEKEACGMYLSGHPLDEFQGLIDKYQTKSSIDIKSSDLETRAVVCGVIKDIKYITSKGGKPMAFLVIEDSIDELDAVMFPSTYNKYSREIGIGRKMIFTGNISLSDEDEGESSLIINSVASFDSIPRRCWIRCASSYEYSLKSNELNRIHENFKGVDTGIIFLEQENQVKIEAGFICSTIPAIRELKKVFGENNVKVTYE